MSFYFLDSSIDEAGAIKYICNEHPQLKYACLLDKKGMEKHKGTDKAYKATLLNVLSAFHYYPALMKVFEGYRGKPVKDAPVMMRAMYKAATQLIGPPRTIPTDIEIECQHATGFTIKAIAYKHGVSERTLYRILNRVEAVA